MNEETHIKLKEEIIKTLEGLSLRDCDMVLKSVSDALPGICLLKPVNV